MTKERLLWLDVAKGFAIILVIIGHTIPFGSYVRNFFFSFHMPLFFILSGYTLPIPYENGHNWNVLLKKDIKRLILPYFGLSCVTNLYDNYFINNESLVNTISIWAESVFWGSGVDFLSHPAIGSLWFLIVLFWSIQIYRLIECVIKYKYFDSLFIVFLTIVGYRLTWFPQSLDIALIALFFIHVDKILKVNNCFLCEDKVYICLITSIFWFICMQHNYYIEMATRSYPLNWLSIIEAVAGSLCIICFLKNILVVRQLSVFLQWAGINSLLVLCIHYLDKYFSWIWIDKPNTISCLLRILIVFLLVYVFLLVKDLLKKAID